MATNPSLSESRGSGAGVGVAETLGGSQISKVRSAISDRRPRSKIFEKLRIG